MRRIVPAAVSAMTCLCLLAACARSPGEPPANAAERDAAPATPTDEREAGANPGAATTAPRTAGEIEFPAIPRIVVPEIVGVGPAQRALEASMQSILDPMQGIRVQPASCSADGVLVPDAGLTSIDEHGNVLRNGDGGIFQLAADGAGTANYGGGIISVNADGSGTINGSGEEGADDAIIRVEADGSGTYNGRHGIISLDGRGGGSWNGDGGVIHNNGDGSGTWNGPQGIVTYNNDGSGTWNGPDGLIVNNGDGTGRIGTPGREVAMAPLPRLAPEGKFPPLQKFAPPGAPCGFVITLEDRVLFDFDRSDIRADAARVLDALGAALAKLDARAMEVGGHTDAKGGDDYNQSLSERRANAVVEALRQRGVSSEVTARGYGESKPVAPNAIDGLDNPAGRQLNRRVEIFVRT